MGKATSELYAKEGAKVIVADLNFNVASTGGLNDNHAGAAYGGIRG
jgi:NAD(P)-dependent dehydrogenase (short-subunit alcohol dehydrogenase family)